MARLYPGPFLRGPGEWWSQKLARLVGRFYPALYGFPPVDQMLLHLVPFLPPHWPG